MANTRIRIAKQLEKSTTPSSVIITDSSNEQIYVAPGTNGQVLMSDGTNVSYQNIPSSATSVSDGTNTVSENAGDTLTFANAGVKTTVTKTGTTVTVTQAVDPSADANNAIVLGTDGKPFVDKSELVTGGSWDDVNNEIILDLASGGTINIPVQDLVGTWLADFVITDGTTSTTINNHGTVTYASDNLIAKNVTGSTVKYGLDTTGATTGQVIKYNGTNPVWSNTVSEVRDNQTGITGTTVTLPSTPTSDLKVYRNGQLQIVGGTNDYTVSGATITFSVALLAWEQVSSIYNV